MQRLDLKTLRYDELGRSVVIEGRKVVVEISHEALETLANRDLTSQEALYTVAEEKLRITRLAQRVPADDGKIHITSSILLNDGIFETGAS